MQERISEYDRKIIIAENKTSEIKKELGRKNATLASAKQKERLMQQNFRA